MEDLIQIGRVSIIKAVNMYDVSMYDISKGAGFTTYITNSVKRNFYNLIRKNIKQASYCSLNSVNSEGFELVDSIPCDENLEENFEKKEEIAHLKKAIDKLPEKERDIIQWFYFQNKTLDQYAREKGIAYRTAVDRKKRALEKLRALLSKN